MKDSHRDDADANRRRRRRKTNSCQTKAPNVYVWHACDCWFFSPL